MHYIVISRSSDTARDREIHLLNAINAIRTWISDLGPCERETTGRRETRPKRSEDDDANPYRPLNLAPYEQFRRKAASVLFDRCRFWARTDWTLPVVRTEQLQLHEQHDRIAAAAAAWPRARSCRGTYRALSFQSRVRPVGESNAGAYRIYPSTVRHRDVTICLDSAHLAVK